MSDASRPSASSDRAVIPDPQWSLLEAVDSGIAVTRPDGIVVFANRLLSDLTGTPIPAIVGSTVFSLFDSKEYAGLEKLHAAALATSAPQRTDARGSAGGVHFSASLVLRRADRLLDPLVVWAVRVLEKGAPEQPRIDRQGAEIGNSSLEIALLGTEIGFWDWDIATDNLTWINNWCKQWGLAEFAGSDHERLWTAQMHDDDLPGYRAALDSHLADLTRVFDVEYRLRDQRGEWVWVQERGRVIERDATGRSVRMVGLCLYADERHRTAQALAHSESRFELALWGTQMGFWDVNAVTDEMHWWNDWCASIDVDPCEGREHSLRWNEQIHPDDLAFTMNYEAMIEGCVDVYEAEYRLRTRNGGWRWVLCRGRATARDSNGRALRVAGVTIDIDAQKRMEMELREGEQRFRGAFEFAAIGMALVAPDGRWLRVNRSLCEIVGYTADELLATNYQSITHPDDLDTDLGQMRRMLDGLLSNYDMEKRYLHRDGHVVWVLLSVSLVRDATGQSMYFVSQIQDITDRKVAEHRLIESELRYRTVADLVPGFVFEGVMRDGYPHPTWVSDGFERVYGCTLARFVELGGTSFYDASTWAQMLAAISAVTPGSDLGIDVSLKNVDGAERWLRVVARVARSADRSDDLRVLGVAEDITERKRLERALREATHREHERLGQEIHDGLGQELTGLAYLASSLASEAANSGSSLAQDLTKLADVARHTIETCRSIARGVSPLTETRGSLIQSLRQIADLAMASGHACVSFEAIENAPLTLPSESCDQLHRITQEAINNALKHSDADKIELSIQIDARLVRIKIVDNGKGLRPSGAAQSGLGIDGMRQRARTIGARLRIENRRRGGTAIVCECPQTPQAE